MSAAVNSSSHADTDERHFESHKKRERQENQIKIHRQNCKRRKKRRASQTAYTRLSCIPVAIIIEQRGRISELQKHLYIYRAQRSQKVCTVQFSA